MTPNRSLAPLLFALTAGCVVDGSTPPDDGTPPPDASTGTLSVEFTGLEVLPPDFVYEGWILVDGAPVSAGRFTVDTPDSSQSFEMDGAILDAATAYILTIEPQPDGDPMPSSVHLLAGDLMAGTADLTIDHGAALGTDFMDAAGSYILETPTSAEAGDYAQGIWWLELTAAGPVATLSLPTLPEGWTYEGWVVVDGSPVSTGTFDSADTTDSDGAGDTSGPDGAPPFPGQDFIDPATMLPGGLAVISVEPVPDTSAAPFTLKPLVDMEIEDLPDDALQDMGNNAASAPWGTASVTSGAAL